MIKVVLTITCDHCGFSHTVEITNPTGADYIQDALDYCGMRQVADGSVYCEGCYTKLATAKRINIGGKE